MQNQHKLIINFAPTGLIPTKDMTPYVPVSISEIVEDVHQAFEIGITMVHLHARDQVSGQPEYKAEIYASMIEGIRRFAPKLIICVSTSGRQFRTFEERAGVLKLDGGVKPDMASLTLSSLNFNQSESINSPDMIKALAMEMLNQGIMPELEAFDAGMINYAKYLQKKGLLHPPFYFNLLMGNIACAQADLIHAGLMVNDLPENSFWSFAGIGRYQLKMNSIAIAAGGGVRVGLEDNIWFDDKQTSLADNAGLLRRIHTIALANEREVMPPSELRGLLRLGDGVTGFGREKAYPLDSVLSD